MRFLIVDDSNTMRRISTKAGVNEALLGDLDRRAPWLFQVARQIVA
jgi:hypothetical protein